MPLTNTEVDSAVPVSGTPNRALMNAALKELIVDIALIQAQLDNTITNVSAPVVTGTNTVGSVLTTTNGTWVGASSYAYQWYQGSTLLSGETASTYTIVVGDAGLAITCRVTASNAVGGTPTVATSNIITVLSVPTNSIAPSLSGTPQVGGTLTANTGAWAFSPTFTYLWKRNGTSISVTTPSYVVQSADQGTQLTCTVTGTNSSGALSVTTAPAQVSGVSSGATAPGFTGTGLSVIETPPTWDWSLSMMEPSRTAVVSSTTYEVGPGQTYTDPSQVPWLTLVAGDIVRIHYRATPYTNICYISCRGAWDQWITIQGVPGPNGERPIISGQNATVRTDAAAAWGANTQFLMGSGVFVIANPTGKGAAYGYKPGYIHITGLKFTNVDRQYTYTNHNGTVTNWGTFVCGIYVYPVEHLAITDCEFTNNGMGLFVNSQAAEAGQSRWILIRGNYFSNNGASASASEHNSYTEGVGVIYEDNYFDAPRLGTGGDNIKERSAGVIIRRNYIRNGVTCISLRDPQSNGAHEYTMFDTLSQRLASLAFVYDNTFVIDAPQVYGAAPQVISLGDGIYGDTGEYRYGELHFHRNRVISKLDVTPYGVTSVALFNYLNTRAGLTWVANNNLFYERNLAGTAAGAPFSLFYWQGLANFSQNWIGPAFVDTYASSGSPGLAAGTQFNGTGTGGLTASASDPLFSNFTAGDFGFQLSSPWFGLIASYPTAVTSRSLSPSGNTTLYPFGAAPRPVNVSAPTITGNPIAGNVLTGNPGSWSGSPTFTYRWLNGGVAISGETGTTYTSVSGDVGDSITFEVTGSNASGAALSGPVTSAATVVASATQPVNTVLPAITGTAQTGSVLTVTSGTWTNSPTSYTYQWLRNGANLSGQTATTYTQVSGDVGTTISARVTAVKGAETGVANAIGVVSQAPSEDPDINGIFQFSKANGTSADTITALFGGTPTDYEVQTNALQTKSGGPSFAGSIMWYQNGQGATQRSQAKKLGASLPAGGLVTLYCNTTTGQAGYSAEFGATDVTIRKNGTYVNQAAHGITWTSDSVMDLRVAPSGANVVVTAYTNGAQRLQITDTSAVLTGGFPGLGFYPVGTPSAIRITSWSDGLAVTL